MERRAYDQYDLETGNWLHRGRVSLLEHLLNEATATHGGGHLLEVGAGVGRNLPMLARYGSVDAAEIDELGIRRLDQLGLADSLYTEPIPFKMRRSYDIICALDVIEHLADDRGAVKWIVDGLVPGGHMIASVPAYQWLFGDHDIALQHYRRYNRTSFLTLLPPEMETVRAGYFNSAVFVPVAVARGVSRLRRKFSADNREPKKQSSIVPGIADRVLGKTLAVEAHLFARRAVAPFGLSFFVLARKRL